MSSTTKGNPTDKGKSRADKPSLPPPSYATYLPGATQNRPSSSRAPPGPPSYATYAPNNSKKYERSKTGAPPVSASIAKPSTSSKAPSVAKAAEGSRSKATLPPPSYATYAPGAASSSKQGASSIAKERPVEKSVMKGPTGQTMASKTAGNVSGRPLGRTITDPSPYKTASNVSGRPLERTTSYSDPYTKGSTMTKTLMPSQSKKPGPEYSVYTEAEAKSMMKKEQSQSPVKSQAPGQSRSDPRLATRSSSYKSLAGSKIDNDRTLQPSQAPKSAYRTQMSRNEDTRSRPPLATTKQSSSARSNFESSPSRMNSSQAVSRQMTRNSSTLESTYARPKTYYHEDDPQEHGSYSNSQAGALVPYQGGAQSQQVARAQTVIHKYKSEQSTIQGQTGDMITVPRYKPLRKGELSDILVKALCRVCKTDESEVGAWCGANVVLWDLKSQEYFLDALWEYLGIPKAKWDDQYEKLEKFRDQEEEKAFDAKSTPEAAAIAALQPLPALPTPEQAAANANATATANVQGVGQGMGIGGGIGGYPGAFVAPLLPAPALYLGGGWRRRRRRWDGPVCDPYCPYWW